MLSSVDLPEPDSPTIATHSPGATARLTSAKSVAAAGRLAPGKDLARPRSSSMPPAALGLLPADVVLQLLDGEVLVRDDVAHDVADRDHADDAPVVDHGQV